jgi:hypothetical protein
MTQIGGNMGMTVRDCLDLRSKEKKYNFLLDIDGTITEDIPNEQDYKMPYAKPYPGVVEAVNEWKSRGHTVTFFTSRTEDMRSMTEEWLDGCGFKYDALIMNKPRGGSYVWIDNMDVAYHHMHDPKMWLEEAKVAEEELCDTCGRYGVCEVVNWTMGPIHECSNCAYKKKQALAGTTEHHSRFRKLKEIYLPPFSGTRVLMMPLRFEDLETLPDDLAHYKRTIQELIDISPVKEGVGYLTIDEKVVKKGDTLRLKGLHVDGIGEDGRTDLGIWAITGLRNYIASMWNDVNKKWWEGAAGIGGMLTVSSPAGCRAWHKDFKGKIGYNGDCEPLRKLFPNNEATVFESGVAYWCNASCVHESMLVEEDTERQFVRLSMPNDAPWYGSYTRNPKGVEPTGPVIREGGFYRAREPQIVLKG